MDKLYFYHGGVNKDFKEKDIDILRLSEKQKKVGRNYAGFYMYDENNRIDAFKYAIQENYRKNSTNKGVIKLTITPDVNIYDIDSFKITRISQEYIKQLKDKGYDLIRGNMLDINEYILLNKNKIEDIEFLPLDKMYDEIEVSRKSR